MKNTVSFINNSKAGKPHFVAQLVGSESTEGGVTPEEALGRLIMKHPRRFHVEIEGDSETFSV